MTTVDALSLSANAAQAQRWNGATGRYWIEHRERLLGQQRNLTPYLFRAAKISRGERVLDVGCGCGDTTIKAARTATGGAAAAAARLLRPKKPSLAAGAVGVDLSAPMLDVARQLATQSGATDVEFIQGDAQVYPFRPNSFDIVISSFGVMFFNDPGAAFKNLATALRPDGRLVFLCWQDDSEVFELPLRAIHTQFHALVPTPDPGVNKLFVDPRGIKRLLTSSGWREIKITSINENVYIGTDVDDVMSLVRDMPSIGNLEASMSNLIARIYNLVDSPEDRELQKKILAGVLAEVKTEYAIRKNSDGVWVDAAAWLVTARRV